MEESENLCHHPDSGVKNDTVRMYEKDKSSGTEGSYTVEDLKGADFACDKYYADMNHSAHVKVPIEGTESGFIMAWRKDNQK